MKISEFRPKDFDKIENAWKTLEKGVEMTWFQTYEWYKIVNKHFLMEKKKAPFRFGTYVLLSDDNDKPLMIAPIQVVHVGFYVKRVGLRKGFYFIGRQGFSDYLDFIYDDFKDEYLNEILTFLKDKYKMNSFFFENISSKVSSYKYLKTLKNVEQIDSLCMSIDLPDDYDTYHAKWTQNMRHGINQAYHRMEKDNIEISYEVVHHLDAKLADELNYIRLQRLKKKQEEAFAALPKTGKIYMTLYNFLIKSISKPVDILNEIEDCWCLITRCNGELGAFYCFEYKPENKTLYSLWVGTNQKYNRYKPGLTQLVQFMKDEIERGKPSFETVDLTRGNERYKYDLKADELVTSQFNFSLE
ncbi:MAG: GNAT family N-acetyltransferase [bacterium]|nr:GNAT family N-acetyltransferase [bacterium]